jgi:NAD(P)-dependent dehydrogenase (short-subunit alcohol dehydrogenase family)
MHDFCGFRAYFLAAAYNPSMTANPKASSLDSWKFANLPSLVPDQTGRRVLITGANSGIGYPAARELARAGAQVIVAARDKAKGEAAVARLKAEVPGAQAELGLLDLASLASVREFAARELDRRLPLDVLIDNAGVMAPPKRLETKDGFELQFGTNVLGHFALTGLLLPAMELAVTKSAARLPQVPRIVILASIAHKRGAIHFDDLRAERSYSPMGSYQQSKLADLMLALELDRRLKAKGSPILAIAAHPGVANTNLFHSGDFSPLERAGRRFMGSLFDLFLNSQDDGALPTIYAAVAPGAQGGGYYGPKGFQEMRGGDVGEAVVAAQARDNAAAARLWGVCEELTGVRFP